MAHQIRIAGLAGAIAAASMAFAPAEAKAAHVLAPATSAETSSHLSQLVQSPQTLDAFAAPGSDTIYEHHRYGWRGYRRHRRGVRAGDVIAGVAILGGIAAIASAANNNRKREREVVVVDRNRDRDYQYRPENRRTTSRSTNGGSGIDNAVSMCLNEIEQNIRVDSVDGASRVGTGWVVTGSLFDGAGFSCQIDNSGRISNVDYGRGRAVSYSGGTGNFARNDGRAEGQLTDDRYARARADVGGTTRPDLGIAPADMGGTANPNSAGPDIAINTQDERLPAYPGGPLPGEKFDQ